MANLQDLMSGDPAKDRMIQTLLKEEDYAYDKVAPRMGVEKRTGKIGIVDRGDKIDDTSYRADKDPAPDTDDLEFNEQSYKCKSIDRRKFIDHGQLNDNVYASEEVIKEIYSERLTNKLKLLKEVALRDKITDLGNYATDNKITVPSGDKFTNSAAKPIAYLLNKASILKKKHGLMPDTIMFTWLAYIEFISHPSVAALLPDPNYKIVTEKDLIPLLKTGALAGLKNIIIAAATYDKNAKKKERDGDFLWADDVWIYKAARPIEGARLTDSGFLVSVESEDPKDFGSLEYEDTNQMTKGIWLENRVSFDLLNCSEKPETLDAAIYIKGTGISAP